MNITGRVCERMSCEESKIIVYTCRYPPLHCLFVCLYQGSWIASPACQYPPIHGMSMDQVNTKKKLQHISCLLYERFAKICKILKPQDNFLSQLNDWTVGMTGIAHPAADFCSVFLVLVCPQKAIIGIHFLAYCGIP